MDFREADQIYKVLYQRYVNGSLSWDLFIKEVTKLHLQDSHGTWWKIQPQDGSWCRWDGAQWIPEDPFHSSNPLKSSLEVQTVSDRTDSSRTDPEKVYRELRQNYENGSLSYTDFVEQVRRLNIPEPGGKSVQISTTKGSISSTAKNSGENVPPHPTKVSGENITPHEISKNAQKIPPSGETVSPRSIGEFRSRLIDYKTFKEMKKELPVAQRPQPWWDYLSILGGVIVAIIWIFYSGIRSLNEGFDILTPILMIGIPIFLVWFRADIDRYLLPIQPFRNKIPKMLLVGMGIVIPFLTAFILSTIFSVQNYPLIHWNTLIGTALAYIVSRDPILAKGYTTPSAQAVKIPLLIIICFSLLIRIVNGDDCLTDPMNAQDCLRTPVYSVAIAGSFDTALSVIVNAPTIIRNIIPGQGGEPSTDIPAGSPNELEDEYRRLMDTLATEKANRDAWAALGKDSGRDGMISLLEAEAEKRRRDLEDLGYVSDYQGTVQGPVGPEDIEHALLEHERNISNIESDTKQIMERDWKTQNVIDNLFRLRSENRDNSVVKWHDILGDTIDKSVRQIATGKNYAGDITGVSLTLGILGRIGAGIISGGQSEFALFPAQLTYNALDYVEKDPNATLKGMYGKMAEETVVYGLIMGGSYAVLNYAGKAVTMNAPLLKETFPTSSKGFTAAKQFLSRDIKSFMPGGSKPLLPVKGPGPSLIAEEVVASGDIAFQQESQQLIIKARTMMAAGEKDTQKILELTSKIRANDLAVNELNADRELSKFITDTYNPVERQAMNNSCTTLAKEAGTDPKNIVMKKFSGRAADQLGRDLDATYYQYVPEAGEQPPHILYPKVTKVLKPEGQLIGNGKFYKDFQTGEIRTTVGGKYYEPAVKIDTQQKIFNESFHEAAGKPTGISAESIGDTFNAKVTTRLSTDSYGYTPEQTGKAISFKVQESVSKSITAQKTSPGNLSGSYANSEHEATKLAVKLDKLIQTKGIDSSKVPHYEKIQKGLEILKKYEGNPLSAENALRSEGMSTHDLGDWLGNAYYWMERGI